MTQNIPAKQHGAPNFAKPTVPILIAALRNGWQDFLKAPVFGLSLAAFTLVAGWGMGALTAWAGHTFWFVLGVFGFPLIAPFAALGTYEVSRLIGLGEKPTVGRVFGVLWAERRRQLPPLCALMMFMLLFWFFLGHMIFALFLGLKPMTHIMTSAEVFLSANGVMMMGIGSLLGGGFALLLFGICVIGLPMLLDREVDYVTALITSIGIVVNNPVVMLGWAVFIAGSLMLAMVPAFLGLLVVLPWLGHASWHVYAGLRRD
ncbi:MAG: DUF2189 domain-containing protein [Sulfitobacter sp.]